MNPTNKEASKMDTKTDRAIAQAAMLPCNVTIAHMTFKKGVKLSTLIGAATRWNEKITQMLDKTERLQKDANLGAELETIIAMRTKFTGEPPYVNDDGVILALNESLDERDALRERVELMEGFIRRMSTQHSGISSGLRDYSSYYYKFVAEAKEVLNE